MNEKAAELADRLREHFSGPMKEDEVEFLRDIQAAIEFAIRNGLSFATIVGAIFHDVEEIHRNLFDLNRAKARGFLPKLAGYSKFKEEDFGGEEEPLS